MSRLQGHQVVMQVVVQLAVDKSRSVCLSVANGEVDVAIIGGHVPEDLKDVLQASPLCCTAAMQPAPSDGCAMLDHLVCASSKQSVGNQLLCNVDQATVHAVLVCCSIPKVQVVFLRT